MSYYSLYLFSFFFYKLENKRVEQVLPRGKGGDSARGEVAGKRTRRVNTVKKMCTHGCKCKNDSSCNYSMNQGKR
jgi:hypothetical protein